MLSHPFTHVHNKHVTLTWSYDPTRMMGNGEAKTSITNTLLVVYEWE